MRVVDADEVAQLGYCAAIDAIREALTAGLDPAHGIPRQVVAVASGQVLLMPAASAQAVGLKLVSVAPDNPARGLPLVQASYLLLDPATLTVRAMIDGTSLTTLRTPAVSVAAALVSLPERHLRVVAFGAGPQGRGHVDALAAVRRVDATFVVRNPERVDVPAVAAGSRAVDDLLAEADVVVCATTAREPVFDSRLVTDDVIVLAVGAHEPDAREVDAALIARSTVVVEDIDTALREAGDVVLAIAEGAMTSDRLLTVADLVSGVVAVPGGRPLVVKTVGMAWEDLVVAERILRA